MSFSPVFFVAAALLIVSLASFPGVNAQFLVISLQANCSASAMSQEILPVGKCIQAFRGSEMWKQVNASFVEHNVCSDKQCSQNCHVFGGVPVGTCVRSERINHEYITAQVVSAQPADPKNSVVIQQFAGERCAQPVMSTAFFLPGYCMPTRNEYLSIACSTDKKTVVFKTCKAPGCSAHGCRPLQVQHVGQCGFENTMASCT